MKTIVNIKLLGYRSRSGCRSSYSSRRWSSDRSKRRSSYRSRRRSSYRSRRRSRSSHGGIGWGGIGIGYLLSM